MKVAAAIILAAVALPPKDGDAYATKIVEPASQFCQALADLQPIERRGAWGAQCFVEAVKMCEELYQLRGFC